jgi:hypothetical protein
VPFLPECGKYYGFVLLRYLDILATEVPEIQSHGFREAIQLFGSNGKSRNRRQSCVLPAPPLPRNRILIDPLAHLKVLVVCADFMQLAADFRGKVHELTAK